MDKKLDRKTVLDKLTKLTNKAMDNADYVDMRPGEKPKKNARVIANGKPGTAISTEKVSTPDYGSKMTETTVIGVQHPEGTTKYVEGIAYPIAPTGGFQAHYGSSNVKVHMDDIISPK